MQLLITCDLCEPGKQAEKIKHNKMNKNNEMVGILAKNISQLTKYGVCNRAVSSKHVTMATN